MVGVLGILGIQFQSMVTSTGWNLRRDLISITGPAESECWIKSKPLGSECPISTKSIPVASDWMNCKYAHLYVQINTVSVGFDMISDTHTREQVDAHALFHRVQSSVVTCKGKSPSDCVRKLLVTDLCRSVELETLCYASLRTLRIGFGQRNC